MKTKVYIDTNIFVYAILHHPLYGKTCSNILRDMKKYYYEAHGSLMVAIELLGSLSKIDPSLAKKAVNLYLSIEQLTIHNISEDVIHLASLINDIVNIKYDSIHAAIMILNDIPIIISNDTNDWLKLINNYERIKENIEEKVYIKTPRKITLITPNNYSKWITKLQ